MRVYSTLPTPPMWMDVRLLRGLVAACIGVVLPVGAIPLNDLDQFSMFQVAGVSQAEPPGQSPIHDAFEGVPGRVLAPPSLPAVPKVASVPGESQTQRQPQSPQQQQQQQRHRFPARLLQAVGGVFASWLEAVKDQEPSMLRLIQLVVVAGTLFCIGRCSHIGGTERLVEAASYLKRFSPHSTQICEDLSAVQGHFEPVRW
mmetsp:Transcript_31233/g.98244  ORF Transcript_31233/g.98244 Transcript_31233/m.98244 type:complete len:201 (+) Transcript_31233:1-603(+)